MGMLNTMKAQGTQYARSIFQRHKKAFSNFRKICDEMLFILKLDKIYYLTHNALSTALSFCGINF